MCHPLFYTTGMGDYPEVEIFSEDDPTNCWPQAIAWCEEMWEGASSLIPETGFRGKQESISLLIERTPERKTWIGWRITVQKCGERWASWQEMVKPQKNQSGSTKTQPGSGEGYRALSAGKSVACLRRELGDRPIIINVTILVYGHPIECCR